MTDISKDAVQRYSVKPWDIRRADVVRDDDGSLVSYDDYRSQAARIEQLEAALAAEKDENRFAYINAALDDNDKDMATARNDALREFIDVCHDRADMMEGVDMECCRGTAMNCASDAENLITEEPS